MSVSFWILALSLYAVIGLLLPFALCRAAAVADADEEATYKAVSNQARAATAKVTPLAARRMSERLDRPNQAVTNEFVDVQRAG